MIEIKPIIQIIFLLEVKQGRKSEKDCSYLEVTKEMDITLITLDITLGRLLS